MDDSHIRRLLAMVSSNRTRPDPPRHRAGEDLRGMSERAPRRTGFALPGLVQPGQQPHRVDLRSPTRPRTPRAPGSTKAKVLDQRRAQFGVAEADAAHLDPAGELPFSRLCRGPRPARASRRGRHQVVDALLAVRISCMLCPGDQFARRLQKQAKSSGHASSMPTVKLAAQDPARGQRQDPDAAEILPSPGTAPAGSPRRPRPPWTCVTAA